MPMPTQIFYPMVQYTESLDGPMNSKIPEFVILVLNFTLILISSFWFYKIVGVITAKPKPKVKQ